MNAQELARWLRDEHEKVNELSTILREKVAAPPQANQQKWIEEARRAFEHLRAHNIKHIALEEQDGYMSVVTQARPMLGRTVERLGHEHYELQYLMTRIHEELQQVRLQDNLLMRDVCARVQNLLSYIEHHENSENLLVLSAFTDEIGATD
jgi:hemerythrin-like domain-containing protein